MSIATPFTRIVRHDGAISVSAREDQLRAIILLNGAMGSSSLCQHVCRSVLELPVGSGLSVMDLWRRQLLSSAMAQRTPALAVRLVNSPGARLAAGIAAGTDPIFRCEYDPVELRGTGGVLRDITLDYPDDAYVLMVSAAQILLEPLDKVISALAEPAADVAFFVHDDDTPAGVTLVRCGCLRSLPAVGFVDFKEQALPKIAKEHSVSVIRSNRTVAASIRTLDQYLRALRLLHRAAARNSEARNAKLEPGNCQSVADAPFSEDWQPAFQIIEDGAVVESGAAIHDSVVLAGARIGSGALIVRSVIGPGATVRRGAAVVDQLVGNPQAQAPSRGKGQS